MRNLRTCDAATAPSGTAGDMAVNVYYGLQRVNLNSCTAIETVDNYGFG